MRAPARVAVSPPPWPHALVRRFLDDALLLALLFLSLPGGALFLALLFRRATGAVVLLIIAARPILASFLTTLLLFVLRIRRGFCALGLGGGRLVFRRLVCLRHDNRAIVRGVLGGVSRGKAKNKASRNGPPSASLVIAFPS